MIIVTGATGTIGRELVQDLKARGAEFKVMVRSEEARKRMVSEGIQAVPGDFDRPESLGLALRGAETVFLLTTPRPDLVKVEGAFLQAAGKAGVKRVVRLSAMGANPSAASALTRGHGQCEAQLEASGMAWTFLRPTLFMQNIGAMYADSIARTSTLFAPAGEARIPWIDARDIAAVAGITLTAAGHEGLIYELTGPEPHSYAEVAALLGVQLGKTVRFVDVPDDAAYQAMTGMGMSGWFAHSLLCLFHDFRSNAHTAVTLGTVARVTGQPPRTLEAYLKQNLPLFRGVKAGSLAHSS
jgi:uncharacterized protein YbjT (DUF2867 family)